MPAKVEIGSTVFVQACARVMSAAWIGRQIRETSTAPGMSISGTAYALRHTFASDIGMGFELAVKSLMQGLSPNEDGEPQVLKTHNLIGSLWKDINDDIQSEIDVDTEFGVCTRYGTYNAGKILPFTKYLVKHEEFLNETVKNRYALAGDTRWKSDHRFVRPISPIARETYNGKTCVDGIGVLMAYWWAIMRKAHKLRWPDELCESDEARTSDRDEAWKMVNRAIGQMFGNVMTKQSDGGAFGGASVNVCMEPTRAGPSGPGPDLGHSL